MSDNNKVIQDSNVLMQPMTSDNNVKQYKELDALLNYKGDSTYLKDMLKKGKALSAFIKDIKLEDDNNYWKSQSNEYKKLLKQSVSKIENIIQKTFMFTGQNPNVDINK